MRDIQKQIINDISGEILHFMCIAADEECNPHQNADQMDHLILDAKERFIKLREIRQELEYVFSGKLKK